MDNQLPEAVYNQLTGRGKQLLPLILEDRVNCSFILFTEREKEILQLIVEGHSSSEIANTLYIPVGIVNTHAFNISNKLDQLEGDSQSAGGGVPRKPHPGSDGVTAEEVRTVPTLQLRSYKYRGRSRFSTCASSL